MLRKRSRPGQREQNMVQRMPDSASESSVRSGSNRKSGGSSLFSLPGLFVGLTKGAPESDPARSPTSPLDCKVFSGLGGYLARSPRSPGLERPRKSWECHRLGLSLVDALNDEAEAGGRVLGSPGSGSVLFGSQMRNSVPSPRIKIGLDRLLAEVGSAASPRSLPKNYVVSSQTRAGSPLPRPSPPETAPELPGGARLEPGKIQSCSTGMGRLLSARQNLSSEVLHAQSKTVESATPLVGAVNCGSSSGSLPITTHGCFGSLSASDIEQSEDYTCIISRGPNPRTTRIFGDCILESYTSDLSDFTTNKQGEEARGGASSSWMLACSEDPMPFPSEDFLRVCYSCKKKLEGKDIYIYRGEKAFCSCSCRSQEILVEEEMEDPATGSSASPSSSSCEEIFLPGMDVAT